jgi:hypothetical protein
MTITKASDKGQVRMTREPWTDTEEPTCITCQLKSQVTGASEQHFTEEEAIVVQGKEAYAMLAASSLLADSFLRKVEKFGIFGEQTSIGKAVAKQQDDDKMGGTRLHRCARQTHPTPSQRY